MQDVAARPAAPEPRRSARPPRETKGRGCPPPESKAVETFPALPGRRSQTRRSRASDPRRDGGDGRSRLGHLSISAGRTPAPRNLRQAPPADSSLTYINPIG